MKKEKREKTFVQKYRGSGKDILLPFCLYFEVKKKLTKTFQIVITLTLRYYLHYSTTMKAKLKGSLVVAD